MGETLAELSIGDPSRKIVEMIFHKAWVNHTSKPLKKVRSVFRVSNTAEVLERFEKYREKVKKKACEQYPRHPRSIVDGNELLRFYGTTMRCSSKEKSVQQVKDLCRDPSCYVCQIVRFNSGEEFCEGNMIPPNTTTRKDLRVSEMATTRVKNERRAIIVCRIIAGAATHEVDGQPEGSDSTHSGEMQLSLEQFVVRNPSAILPCFVIVHN